MKKAGNKQLTNVAITSSLDVSVSNTVDADVYSMCRNILHDGDHRTSNRIHRRWKVAGGLL